MKSIRKWKLPFCVGGALSIAPMLAGLTMFAAPHSGALSRFTYLVFGLGLPGLVFEALIMSMHEPHGGGTPLEMFFVVMPLNFVFYTLLTRGLMAIIMMFTRRKGPHRDGA